MGHHLHSHLGPELSLQYEPVRHPDTNARLCIDRLWFLLPQGRPEMKGLGKQNLLAVLFPHNIQSPSWQIHSPASSERNIHAEPSIPWSSRRTVSGEPPSSIWHLPPTVQPKACRAEHSGNMGKSDIPRCWWIMIVIGTRSSAYTSFVLLSKNSSSTSWNRNPTTGAEETSWQLEGMIARPVPTDGRRSLTCCADWFGLGR